MNNGIKYIEIGDLVDILSELPRHYQLVTNRVGNLSVYNKNGVSLGYIDLLKEKFERYS